MKRAIIPILVLLMLTSLACSFSVNLPDVKTATGPTETLTVNEPAPNAGQTTRVTLQMGAGKFTLSGGASANLVEGAIKYNIPDWKPVVSHSNGEVTVKQETSGRINFPDNNLVNDWNLKLSNSQVIDLTLQAGAYQGDIDLSGVHLANLAITDGASQTDVHFNTLNPTRMQELSYKTGASQVKLYGLANANFSDMTFESGAGDYSLDFGGTLQQDATVTIKSGVSQVTLIVPSGMQVRVNNQAGVGSVDTAGSWTTNGNTYTTQGEGPTLTVNVNMGVGSLKLEQH
jgi:hypothetical protein